MKVGDLVKLREDYDLDADPFKHELEPSVGYVGVVTRIFKPKDTLNPYIAVVFTNGHVVDFFYGGKFVVVSST